MFKLLFRPSALFQANKIENIFDWFRDSLQILIEYQLRRLATGLLYKITTYVSSLFELIKKS